MLNCNRYNVFLDLIFGLVLPNLPGNNVMGRETSVFYRSFSIFGDV